MNDLQVSEIAEATQRAVRACENFVRAMGRAGVSTRKTGEVFRRLTEEIERVTREAIAEAIAEENRRRIDREWRWIGAIVAVYACVLLYLSLR